MTIQSMFYSLKKYGFVQDGDDLPPREWADGQMHEKVAGEWQVVSEENSESKKIPKEKKIKLRADLLTKLKEQAQIGKVENKSLGQVIFSKKSIDKMGCDKALNKSLVNGFSAEEHFDAAGRIVELFKNADVKRTDPDKYGDPNIVSMKRLTQNFKTCEGNNATAWITVKESTQHGHKLYSIEVMDIKKADERSAVSGGAD